MGRRRRRRRWALARSRFHAVWVGGQTERERPPRPRIRFCPQSPAVRFDDRAADDGDHEEEPFEVERPEREGRAERDDDGQERVSVSHHGSLNHGLNGQHSAALGSRSLPHGGPLLTLHALTFRLRRGGATPPPPPPPRAGPPLYPPVGGGPPTLGPSSLPRGRTCKSARADRLSRLPTDRRLAFRVSAPA